ncbi:MAG: transposase [Planctomycetes bacterium]|nr:transposase [Planctomycetota bacterium]
MVSGDGWSLQAGVRIRAGDRAGLERLCKYVFRPALSTERLTRLTDGKIAYGFRKPRYDGATHIVLHPLELLEKLTALVAPPRFHTSCYDGVLAPHARARAVVVAGAREPVEGDECCRRGAKPLARGSEPKIRGLEKVVRPHRTPAGYTEIFGAPRGGYGHGERNRATVAEPEMPREAAQERRGRTPWAELMARSMGLTGTREYP